MKNILVAIDLEDNSQIVVENAAALAEKFAAKIWILHVSDPDPDFVGNAVGPQYIRDNLAMEIHHEHKLVKQFVDMVKARGIAADGLLIQGITIEMILAETEKLQIDLLVLGRHKHNLLYNFFAGSTHTSVVNKSKIPVLVVPI